MALQAVNRGESLSDRAYRMLRNAILSGELAPGEPLTEESLAERLQISRTPIRTALHRLVSEGLAETACGKGISVREVGDRDVRQVDEVRAVLEPLSASLCAARGLSAGEIEELRGYCEAQQQAAARGGVRDYFHYGDLFHIRLAECSGNNFLAAMISRATLTAARYLLSSPHPERQLGRFPGEHLEVLSLVAARRTEEAREAMRRHIGHSLVQTEEQVSAHRGERNPPQQ